MVKILDAMNLMDEETETFRYSRDAITHIKFSHDSTFLATVVSESVYYNRIVNEEIQRLVCESESGF